MALKKCRICKNMININASKCPECGADQPKALRRLGIGILLLFCFIIFLIFISSNHTPSDNKSNRPSSQDQPVPSQALPAAVKLQCKPYEILESDSESATIYAPVAITKDERAQTAMQAAVDLQEKTGADRVSITMVASPKLKDCGWDIAGADYNPYYKGWAVDAYAGQINAQILEIIRVECEYEKNYLWDYDKALRYIRKHLRKTEKDLSDIPFFITDIYDVSQNLAAAFGASSPEQARAQAKAKDPNIHFTKDLCFACLAQDDLDKIFSMIAQRDKEAFFKMLANYSCIDYPVGSQVYIMESPGLSKVKIRARGSTEGLWTFRNFIN